MRMAVALMRCAGRRGEFGQTAWGFARDGSRDSGRLRTDLRPDNCAVAPPHSHAHARIEAAAGVDPPDGAGGGGDEGGCGGGGEGSFE